jgi:asparagine synthase (glutamine-hydrolysing)
VCGIIGVAAQSGVCDRSVLTIGRDALAHRGPDDVGEWWSSDGLVGFGHRRLAIVDLSPGGHQPMHDATADLTIVFNGEIYNFRALRTELEGRGHVFRSNSDTEVVLAAYREWGEDFLTRLNGMFALGLYDSTRRTLMLARDRAGEKPLFYLLTDGRLVFASELKALLVDRRVARAIDHQALDLYLGIGYVPGERCILKGARKLPAAHALRFDVTTGAMRRWRYWQLPDPLAHGSAVDELRLLDELEDLLEESVRGQLAADVPVGVLLSGGVDSSLITAMAVRTARRVKTFTVGFPDFGTHDESAHARLIAGHFRTEHLELEADRVAPAVLDVLARQYDEPIVDSSMIPTFLVSRLVRQHCTVALGGDGGDELFGGYSHYNRLLWTRDRTAWLPRSVGKAVARFARSGLPVGWRGRNWLQTLGVDLNVTLPLIASLFDSSERRRLLNGGAAPCELAEDLWRAFVPRVDDLLERVSRTEFVTYMAEDILVKVDRASMLNSLEVRAPLLDFRIIEFAFGRVPARLKATAVSRKVLLKRLAGRLLPPQFDQQRKQGFSIPLAAWLRAGPWRDRFREILLDAHSMFDRGAVAELLQGQDRGRHNQERLFGLTVFELWRREYGMSL